MKRIFTAMVAGVMLLSTTTTHAQQVGINTNTPNAAAALEIQPSGNAKGVLFPAVGLTGTTDAVTITSPPKGLIVWNPGTSGLAPEGYYYNAGTPAAPSWTKVVNGAVMTNTLTNGKIWIGNATNVATEQTVSGDVTISNTGVATIQDNAVDGTDITITSEGNGSMMYFNGTDWVNLAPGTAGQVLQSNGAAAPTWVSVNSTLTKKDIVPNTSSVVSITNGTAQVIGASNVTMDVQGTNGGVLYGAGTGVPAQFSTAGTAGQLLQSNGAAAPTWIDKSTILKAQNGLSVATSGGTATTAAPATELGGTLLKNTTVDQSTFNMNFSSTAATGTSHFTVDGTTLNVDAVNNRVGVGTAAPVATFDITGQPTTTTVPDGVIAPRLTRADLIGKSPVYNAAQTGAIVYVTALGGTVDGKTTNVTAIGYYYFDGTVWLPMASQNDVLQVRAYSGADIAGATGTTFTDRTFTPPSFFPKSANSTLIIEIDGDYQINGTNGDWYQIDVMVNGSVISTKSQRFNDGSAGGTRSSVMMPIMVFYNNTTLAAKTISYRIRQAGGDDWAQVNTKYVKFTEVVKYSASSNGTALVANYFGTSACTGATGTISGSMVIYMPLNSITMSIYANVITPGTYNISTNTQGGVTFSASGTFTATGCQLVTLTASGVANALGNFTWTTTTSPSISATATIKCDEVIPVVEITSATTGRIWLDRNLGAYAAATSPTDAAGYGSLYQWGRLTDGHQCRTSGTTTVLSSSDNPGHNLFITTSSAPYNWRNPQNNALWQGVSGTNNPCPSGYRLPTTTEFLAEAAAWTAPYDVSAYNALKLTLNGHRPYSGGSISAEGTEAHYWTSTTNIITPSYSEYYILYSIFKNYGATPRANGKGVRCIKN